MAFKIAIASGKGGTGKTTVSVCLYKFLSDRNNGRIHLVDCDVEEPNDIIFFSESIKTHEEEIFQLIPSIDKEKCTFCRKCSDYCEFNAMVVIPPARFAEVNSSLCHSCGACLVACDQSAISEHPEPIGKINFYHTKTVNGLTEGKLKIGSGMQTMLIKELKKKVSDENDLIIFDAPPGTSCPVVETINDANFIILVAEPTPFGLHDIKLMVSLIKELNIPFGVMINKAGLGDHAIYDYLNEENINLLGEIPFSKNFAKKYAGGQITSDIPEIIKSGYTVLMDTLDEKIVEYEGNNYFKW